MNAQEAWEMTRRGVRKNVVDVWIERIYRRIEKATLKGERSLLEPFKGFWLTRPTEEEARDIANHFEGLGFEITHFTYPLSEIAIAWGVKIVTGCSD